MHCCCCWCLTDPESPAAWPTRVSGEAGSHADYDQLEGVPWRPVATVERFNIGRRDGADVVSAHQTDAVRRLLQYCWLDAGRWEQNKYKLTERYHIVLLCLFILSVGCLVGSSMEFVGHWWCVMQLDRVDRDLYVSSCPVSVIAFHEHFAFIAITDPWFIKALAHNLFSYGYDDVNLKRGDISAFNPLTPIVFIWVQL